MDQMLYQLKQAYDAKQNTQSELGKLAKLGEEAAELAAAIAKYVEIESGIYECRSGPEKAFSHVIEEACDVFNMLEVCRLTPGTAQPKMRDVLIDRLVYKGFRFIDRLELYKEWKKARDPQVRAKGGKKHKHHGGGKRNRGIPALDIIIRMERDGGCTLNSARRVNNNPWAEGLRGDFE